MPTLHRGWGSGLEGIVKTREIDLRHDADPVRFGTAMLACEGYAPDCSYHGRCMNGGSCFASPPNLVAARMVQAIIPTDGRAGQHLAYLKRVAEMLRAGEIHI